MAVKKQQLFVFSCLLAIVFCTVAHGSSTFYVDGRNGNDSNSGSQVKPFKTIVKARDTIRVMKNTTGLPDGEVAVLVLPGDYEFIDDPLEFTAEDSGTEKSPILYGSFPGAGTHLTAGVRIDNWIDIASPVQDPVMVSLLKDKEKIVQINLRNLGITNFGDLQSGQLGDCANNKVELFTPDMNMVLARYPNIDSESDHWQWLSAGKVINKQKSFSFDTNSTIRNRILTWKNTSTLWLHGYWSYDWADNYVKVDEISKTDAAFVVSEKTPPVYGFVANARYIAINILEELDVENEYYIDRGSGVLYMFESAVKHLSTGKEACVSVGESVLTLNSASFMIFVGFQIDCAKTTAVVANNVNNVTLSGVNVRFCGGSGIEFRGYNNTLAGPTVTRTGCGGIHLSGGDQKSLTRGNNLLIGSAISYWSNWKRTYNPGLSWGGVGNRYLANSFTNGPHSGVLGGGNDCLFESNVFDTLCYESSDSGAFYTGRSWISRGNILRGNKFRNIKNTEKIHLGAPSVQAIYLDDQMSGYTIEYNTFYNCHCGTFIGGGRRNIVHNNTCQNCDLCIHVDDRGLTWQKADCSPGGLFEQQLKSVNYQEPPWSNHYPELHDILNDHPCVPVYNDIEFNHYCQSKQFIDVSDSDLSKWMITVKNNTDKC